MHTSADGTMFHSDDFFTSDLHFGHELMRDKRGFATIDEMDEKLVSNWNDRVSKHCRAFILGDISWHKWDATQKLMDRLNGQKFLILGNHDEGVVKHIKNFAWIKDVAMVTVKTKFKNQRIFLSHYAHRVWASSHRGVWHLYGHSHGSLADDPNSLSFDIGVDCWNLYPVNFFEVEARMATKTYVPVDHHAPKETP